MKDLRATRPVRESVVDYDVHGLVGVRLIDPARRDVAAVSAQIGPMRGGLAREPEITIHFVDSVVPGRGLRWVNPGQLGFTDDGFFLFARGGDGKAAARMSLDGAGGSFALECRSGVGTVPLLRSLLDLQMLRKGLVALHASAFTYEGTGVLVAGWARGGKTTSLLAFAARGAAFIGDDRVYLSAEEKRLYGLAEPVSLRARHLAELPRYREHVGWQARSRLRAWSALGRLAATASTANRRLDRGDLRRRVAALADEAAVAVRPEAAFASCPLRGKLDKAFLAIAHERDDVRVEPIEPERLAERLVFALRADRLQLTALYLAYRFAFPDRSSALIEEADEAERGAVVQALAGSDAYALYHPHPAPVQGLYDAMMPVLA